MYSKVTLLSACIAICHAGVLVEDPHRAVSSQSIVRHDQPIQRLDAHLAAPIYTHAVQHAGPIVQHASPIVHAVQTSPLVQHASPLIQHASPLIQHASPLIQHASPFIQHATPLIQHATPLIQHVSPVVHAPAAVAHAQAEEHAPAHYEFSYSVEDPQTGDHKSQHETREGDLVKGEYSLLQPDGSIRKVEYTADDHSGFNAIVHNSAPSAHAAPAPVHAAPVVHVTPLLAQHH